MGRIYRTSRSGHSAEGELLTEARPLVAKQNVVRMALIGLVICAATSQRGIAQDAKAAPQSTSTLDAETAASSPVAAELMALQRRIEEDVVQGKADDLAPLLSDDFTMVHGDAWTIGKRPALADDKKSFLKRVSDREYLVHDLDDVRFEIHGDIAISYGRYVSLFMPNGRAATTPSRLNSVWFERVFARRNGKWVYLSHRTVHGPILSPAGIDPTALKANEVPSGDSQSPGADGGGTTQVAEASDPTVNNSAAAKELMEVEKNMEAAVVRGDVAYVSNVLSDDFLMGHGDGWVRGGRPAVVDNKEGFLKRVANKQYFARELDSVKVELHGDVAITYGRYIAQEKTNNPIGSWFSVWYERVYVNRSGKWIYLSHRTVHGPTFGPDKASVSSK